jgi:hypothetical protein
MSQILITNLFLKYAYKAGSGLVGRKNLGS